MTDPGRTYSHARAAGFTSVLDYCVELEDVIEGIVAADRPYGPYVDPEDMVAALMRARELVASWEQA